MLLFNKNCEHCGHTYDKTLDKCPSCQIDNREPLNRSFNKNVLFLRPGIQFGLFLLGFSYCGMLGIELFLSIFINPQTVIGATLLTSLTYTFMFICLVGICLLDRSPSFVRRFYRYQDYLYGIGYAALLIGLGFLIPAIMQKITGIPSSPEEADNTNQALARLMVKNYPIATFFVLTILGPVCEEITYRVGLFSFLKRINTVLAFIVTTLIFAFIHFDLTAENMQLELVALPSYICLGLLLTTAYQHRGPACSITAHMIYNVSAWLMLLLGK